MISGDLYEELHRVLLVPSLSYMQEALEMQVTSVDTFQSSEVEWMVL